MINKKKIAVIGLKGLPAYGGAATVGENVIENLKDLYDFTVYSTSSHTNLKTGFYRGYRQIVFPRIPLRRLNTLLYYILTAFHALLYSRYDLVHLHHKDAAFIIPLLKLKYRVLLTTHGSFGVRPKWKNYKWFFALQEKYFVKTANIITCVSKNEQRQYKTRLNIETNYIPNGINIVDMGTLNTREINEEYIFFGAGRIIKTKGCEILLQSLKILEYRGLVVIAGDLEQTPDYKKEILLLSQGLNVMFLGLIFDKERLLSLLRFSKLFIFPSSREAMSIMLLEGLSVRAKTICSDIIQNRDVVSENDVLFFETDNTVDLASKISWALNNPEIMENKAENAFSLLKTNYSWMSISANYSKYFQNLLSN
jgi:glycosyltransferase involved in cell wall biosynthesis